MAEVFIPRESSGRDEARARGEERGLAAVSWPSGRELAGLLTVLALTLLVFMPILDAGFVYDDYHYVAESPLVCGPEVGLLDILGQPFPWAEQSLGWYRPLTVLSWRLQASGGVPDAPAMHAANLGLHLLVVVLLWLWLRRRLEPGAALVATLLFAVMTGHAEAVLWISARSELLVAVLCLVALLCLDAEGLGDRAAHGGRMALAGVVGAFVIGLLARESMAALLAMAPAVVLARQRRGVADRRLLRSALVVLGALAAVLVLYMALRVGTLGRIMPPADESAGASMVGRLGLVGRSWWQAVASMVWVSRPTIEYEWLEPLAWTWRSLLGWVLVVVGVVAWIEAGSRTVREGVAVVLTGFLLYCHLLASTELFAERFLYLPSIGLCLLAGVLYAAVRQRLGSGWVSALAVVMCLATGARTYGYATVWQDDLSLWRSAVRAAPASPVARLNLATALERVGEPRRAVEVLEDLVGHPEVDREARVRLIRALGADDDPRAGCLAAGVALDRYPDDPELLYLLARHQLLGGWTTQAARTVERLQAIGQGTGDRSEAARRWLQRLAAAEPGLWEHGDS